MSGNPKISDLVRLEAVTLLNSRGGRDLARWVLSELRRGVRLEPDWVAHILVQVKTPPEVAKLVASSVCLRAASAVLLDQIETQRARVQAVTPVASMILGRLKRRI